MTDRSGRTRTLAFVLIQLGVIFVLLELLLRLAGAQIGLRALLYMPEAEPLYGDASTLEELMDKSLIGFSPHTVQYGFILNSRSMRTKEYADHPAAGVRRVLAFGDSFTFASGGLPHADHWTNFLEQELSRSGPVEVLRLGVPATGPLFQYRLWQLEGSRLAADLVVQAFFVGNDFFGRQSTEPLTPDEAKGIGGRLARWSWTFRVVRNLSRVFEGTERDADRSEVDKPAGTSGGFELPGYTHPWPTDRATFSEERYVKIETRRMALCLHRENDRFERLLGNVGSTILKFRREVEDAGARFVVMVIPDEYQIDLQVQRDVMAATGTTVDDYDFERPQRRLSQWLRARDVEVFDLLPYFLELGRSRRLYNLRDTHWNRDGNRLAAMLLAAYLEGRETTSADFVFEFHDTPPDENTTGANSPKLPGN
jgi:lysophospholipase L1-like esterase